MSKFTTKIYRYISGELHIIEEEFEHIEHAIEHGLKFIGHLFKVFDHEGCVCHDSHHHDNGPYC